MSNLSGAVSFLDERSNGEYFELDGAVSFKKAVNPLALQVKRGGVEPGPVSLDLDPKGSLYPHGRVRRASPSPGGLLIEGQCPSTRGRPTRLALINHTATTLACHGHTNMNIPDPVRSRKSSMFGPD